MRYHAAFVRLASGGAMRNPLAVVLTASLLAIALPATAAAPADDIAVSVERDGNTFTVSLDMRIAADASEVWEVFTDFDRMAQILSNVDASKIVSRDGNVIQVAQKSHAAVGLVRLSLDNVRQIDLVPNREIRSRLLKGDVKSSDFTTRLTPDGAATRVSVKGKFTVGALSGAAINEDAVAKQTRRQYDELRAEVLRRKAKEPPPPCLLAKTCGEQGSG
jgi:carbon monoxide dehydrogenase subunit G